MSEIILLDIGLTPSIGMKVLEQALKSHGIGCEIIGFHKEVGKGIHYDSGNINVISVARSTDAVKNKIKLLAPKISSARFLGMQFIEDPYEIALKLPVAVFLKKEFPKAILIGGGSGINTDPKRFFSAAKLDFAIRGEADKALPALVTALKKGSEKELERIPGLVRRTKGKIVLPKEISSLSRQEVARLPFAHVEERKSEAIIYSAKGCPNACIYCSVPRKGKFAPVSDKTIINGLLELAKNKEITRVAFVDDQFFADKARATRLLKKMINTGLAKRFRFETLVTVDSLIGKKGIETGLIALAKKAGFKKFSLGTESLNDNILRELKSGRYNSIQAIKLNDYLVEKGFMVGNFMMAAGFRTKARDYIESFYRAAAKGIRGSGSYEPLNYVTAYRNTPLYSVALKEGLLYTRKGKKVNNAEKDRKPSARYIMPRDEQLREFFTQIMNKRAPKGIKHPPKVFIEQVIGLSKKIEQGKQERKGFSRRLMKIFGQKQAATNREQNLANEIFASLIEKECEARNITMTDENLNELSKDKELLKKTYILSQLKAKFLKNTLEKIEKARGTKRLRSILTARKQFGVSPTAERWAGTYKPRAAQRV